MSLLRSTPLQQGVNPAAIKAVLDKWTEYEMDIHSFMLLKNGHVISEVYWEPYQPHIPHLLNSLSKSFTATAIGIAAEEKKLSLEDTVISFFPQYITAEIQQNMDALKVKHLLSMSTGHDQDTTGLLLQSDDWVETFFNIPIVHEPGTHFLYNTGASYMLSAVLFAATGEQLLDYLQPRLFEPLGLTEITTETCPQGIHAGGYGMSVKSEDIAKFGQLYLQNGQWNGQQIVPEWFIKEASSKQVSNGDDLHSDWAQGYGYQFWQCRHNAYRADGAFGQYCVVIPEHQTVIVTTAGVMEQQELLQVFWDELLPHLSVDANELSIDGQNQFMQAIEQYRYAPPHFSDNPVQVANWNKRIYTVAPNDVQITKLSFQFNKEHSILQLHSEEGEQTLQIGHGAWIYNQLTLNGIELPVAMCATWISRNKYIIEVRMLSKPYSDKWHCHFVGESLHISLTRNVWIMPNSPLSKPYLPTLVGMRSQSS